MGLCLYINFIQLNLKFVATRHQSKYNRMCVWNICFELVPHNMERIPTPDSFLINLHHFWSIDTFRHADSNIVLKEFQIQRSKDSIHPLS